MCGIFAICHCGATEKFPIEEAIKHSGRQMHRGPDFRGNFKNDSTGDILCHERLAIMDLGCVQPLMGSKEGRMVVHNGEIYNHNKLRKEELNDMELRTNCDSEVIIFLYEKMRNGAMCNLLDGVFAFALICDNQFMAARDPIGVKQMYYGKDRLERVFFSNEMKAIEDLCGQHTVKHFPPGHFYTPEEGFVRYYQPVWIDYRLATHDADLNLIRETFIKSVHKRLMSDAPLGVLLSGGLDSSLVSSIASREMKKRGLVVNSFSIGVDERAPDLLAAKQVAEFIGSKHHEFHFNIEDGIRNLRNLIWHLETYDVTSIRASTPMYFLSEKIRQMGIKVVLSGEGADEVFGGYLYFHNAPNDEEFQKETIDRVLHLHTSDCLRADKSAMAHSVEVRVPFLDKEFLDVSMLTVPRNKRPQMFDGRSQEKYLLRKAFDVEKEPFLPHNILWRQKEQFSDGVGYNWIDRLMDYCASQISDEELSKAAEIFPYNTPHSKESFYMRRIFTELFPSENAAQSVRKWIPKWQNNEDPSGRASTVHIQHSQENLQKSAAIDGSVSAGRTQYA